MPLRKIASGGRKLQAMLREGNLAHGPALPLKGNVINDVNSIVVVTGALCFSLYLTLVYRRCRALLSVPVASPTKMLVAKNGVGTAFELQQAIAVLIPTSYHQRAVQRCP
jgi:hypothetical protein